MRASVLLCTWDFDEFDLHEQLGVCYRSLIDCKPRLDYHVSILFSSRTVSDMMLAKDVSSKLASLYSDTIFDVFETSVCQFTSMHDKFYKSAKLKTYRLKLEADRVDALYRACICMANRGVSYHFCSNVNGVHPLFPLPCWLCCLPCELVYVLRRQQSGKRRTNCPAAVLRAVAAGVSMDNNALDDDAAARLVLCLNRSPLYYSPLAAVEALVQIDIVESPTVTIVATATARRASETVPLLGIPRRQNTC